MERCPLCRAALNGAETCRRCKAELGSAIRVEREAHALAGAAMRCLALGDEAAAEGLLRRAATLHGTPEVRILWRALAGRLDVLADLSGLGWDGDLAAMREGYEPDPNR
jgi:hypothetical protein